jgi:hypothetical protein
MKYATTILGGETNMIKTTTEPRGIKIPAMFTAVMIAIYASSAASAGERVSARGILDIVRYEEECEPGLLTRTEKMAMLMSVAGENTDVAKRQTDIFIRDVGIQKFCTLTKQFAHEWVSALRRTP